VLAYNCAQRAHQNTAENMATVRPRLALDVKVIQTPLCIFH
jgi:hypothetical protein